MDPCALVPKEDWAKFYIDKPGKPKRDETLNSPMCFYDNDKGIFDIIVVTTEGIAAWGSGKRAAQPSEVDPVYGFPAISLMRPGPNTSCFVVVDVADGQYLLASVIVDPTEVSTVPERCVYAHLLAESAMATLVKPSSSTPVRPREIRLDGRDPCGLVPESDWPAFHITRPGERQNDDTLRQPECFYGNNVGVFDIKLVTVEGIGAWRSGERTAQPREVAPVRGFPAISLVQPRDQTGCDIVVDVADGQYLMATVIVDPTEASRVPERCDFAHRLAESAMGTLVR